MLKYLFNIIVFLALGVWIGSILFFGAGVASLLFQPDMLPNRTMAGMINSAVLGRLGRIEIVAAVMVIGGTLYTAARYRRWNNWLALAIAVVMTGAAAYTSSVLYPKMDQLRVAIGDFDHLPAEKSDMKAEFDKGHKLYSNIEKGVLFGGVLVLVLQTIGLVSAAESGNRRRKAEPKPERPAKKNGAMPRQEPLRQQQSVRQEKAVPAIAEHEVAHAEIDSESKKAVATG